jgi:hypothetical protein
VSLVRVGFILIAAGAEQGFDHARPRWALYDEPGLVCSFDSEPLEQLETIETEAGAHTSGWDPVGRCLYVFCPRSVGAAVDEDPA